MVKSTAMIVICPLIPTQFVISLNFSMKIKFVYIFFFYLHFGAVKKDWCNETTDALINWVRPLYTKSETPFVELELVWS